MSINPNQRVPPYLILTSNAFHQQTPHTSHLFILTPTPPPNNLPGPFHCFLVPRLRPLKQHLRNPKTQHHLIYEPRKPNFAITAVYIYWRSVTRIKGGDALTNRHFGPRVGCRQGKENLPHFLGLTPHFHHQLPQQLRCQPKMIALMRNKSPHHLQAFGK
jgi:hypothetical protein